MRRICAESPRNCASLLHLAEIVGRVGRVRHVDLEAARDRGVAAARGHRALLRERVERAVVDVGERGRDQGHLVRLRAVAIVRRRRVEELGLRLARVGAADQGAGEIGVHERVEREELPAGPVSELLEQPAAQPAAQLRSQLILVS